MGFAIAHSNDCAHISFAIPYFSLANQLFHIGRWNCRIPYSQLALDPGKAILAQAVEARTYNDGAVYSAYPKGTIKNPELVPFHIIREAMHAQGYVLTGGGSGE